MKKLKLLLITLFVAAFIVPFSVRATEDNDAQDVERSKINIYMFRGEGCGFCAKALSFFEEIKEEYGQYYNLITYEVWKDADNAAFMDEVAEYLNKKITGVPFIIIGDKTFPGFQDAWKEDIKAQIVAEYNKNDDERTDIISNIKNGISNKNDKGDLIISIVSVGAIAGIIAFVVLARKGNTEGNRRVTVTKKDEDFEDETEDDATEEETKEKNVKSEKKKETKKTTVKKSKTTSTKKKEKKL